MDTDNPWIALLKAQIHAWSALCTDNPCIEQTLLDLWIAQLQYTHPCHIRFTIGRPCQTRLHCDLPTHTCIGTIKEEPTEIKRGHYQFLLLLITIILLFWLLVWAWVSPTLIMTTALACGIILSIYVCMYHLPCICHTLVPEIRVRPEMLHVFWCVINNCTRLNFVCR